MCPRAGYQNQRDEKACLRLALFQSTPLEGISFILFNRHRACLLGRTYMVLIKLKMVNTVAQQSAALQR